MDLSQDISLTGGIAKSVYPKLTTWKDLNKIVREVKDQCTSSGWTQDEGTYASSYLQFQSPPFHANLLNPYPCFGLGVFRLLGFFLNKDLVTIQFYVLWDPYSSVDGVGAGTGGDTDPTGQGWAIDYYGYPNIIGIKVGKTAEDTVDNFLGTLSGNTPFDCGGYDPGTQLAHVEAQIYGADYNLDPSQWETIGYNVFGPPPRGGGYRVTCQAANRYTPTGDDDPKPAYPGTQYQLEAKLDNQDRMSLRCGFPDLASQTSDASNPTYFTLSTQQLTLFTDPFQIFIYNPGPFGTSTHGGENFAASAPLIPDEFLPDISYSAFCTDSLRDSDGTVGGPRTAVKVNDFFQSGDWGNVFGEVGVNLFGPQVGAGSTECDSGSGRPITNAALVAAVIQHASTYKTGQTRIVGILWNAFLCMRYENIGGETIWPVGNGGGGYKTEIFCSAAGALQKSLYLISGVKDDG